MLKLILTIICIALLSACSKGEVKRPSEEAIIAKEAMDFIKTLKESYMRGDEERLREMFVSEELIKSFSIKDRPSDLEFTFRWIEIKEREKKTDVYVTWKGRWKKDTGDMETRGLCLFVLEGRPFRLAKILRENPFKGAN